MPIITYPVFISAIGSLIMLFFTIIITTSIKQKKRMEAINMGFLKKEKKKKIEFGKKKETPAEEIEEPVEFDGEITDPEDIGTPEKPDLLDIPPPPSEEDTPKENVVPSIDLVVNRTFELLVAINENQTAMNKNFIAGMKRIIPLLESINKKLEKATK